MFNSPIVEVVIGLTFFFLVLSLCATAIVEGIVESRQWRGRLLHSKLRSLLGTRLVDMFYQDRRIRDLTSGKSPWHMRVGLSRAIVRIPVLGKLWDTWRSWGKFSSTSLYQARVIAGSASAGRLPSQIPPAVFADVILDWLQGVEAPLQLHPDYAAPDAIPDELATLWKAMSVRTDGSQEELSTELQRWYSQSMERTSGEFKRRIRFALYGIGLIFVLATNADTVRLGSALYQDPTMRAQSLAITEQIVASCREGASKCAALGDVVKSTLNNPTSPDFLGWRDGQLEQLRGPSWTLAWALIGWSLTILAIGLGADFWFGALKRMLMLRSGSIGANGAVPQDGASPPRVETLAPRSVKGHEPLDLESPSVEGLRGFQPLRFAESNVHAFWLAQLASLAYSDHATLRGSSLLKCHRLVPQAIDANGTQAFVFTGPEVCIVAFRGTEQKLEDWITDANARQHQNPWDNVDDTIKVHSGFHKALDHVWPQLLDLVSRADLPVWITGHSLGGALAVLAAYRLEAVESPGVRVAGVYTFGQPRVGNMAWTRSFPLELEQRIFRFVNDRDVVPLVPPPRPIEYSHIGHARYFDASGRLHQNRTLWERISEQLSPVMAQVAAGAEGWETLAKQHARERVADHGMARYIECFERLDAVRALWRAT